MKYLIVFAVLVASAAQAATVVIVSEPKGAEVSLSGSKLVYGKTPLRIQMDEGPCTIVLRKPDYVELTHSFTVGRKLVALKLEMKEKKYPVDFLFEDIGESTVDWLAVDKTGAIFGKIPGTLLLPAGKFQMLAVKHGFRDIRFSFAVTRNSMTVELKAPQKGYGSFKRIITHRVCKARQWIHFPPDTDGIRIFTFHPNGKYVLKTPYRHYPGVWKVEDDGSITWHQLKNSPRTLSWDEKFESLNGPRPTGLPGDWHLIPKK
jgi:hypothetical protein